MKPAPSTAGTLLWPPQQMASFNNCSFSGNVGKDPEVRYFEDGKMVANFNLAVQGRRDAGALWIKVKVWGKQAQVIADYVRKGSQLIVNGELEEETWTKEGVKNTRMVLNCRQFHFVGGRRGEDLDSNSQPANKRSSAPRSQRAEEPDIDEEIPF
jgi:single-strand DNA-binding protein